MTATEQTETEVTRSEERYEALIDRLFEAAQKAITDDAVRAKLQNEGGDTLIATRDEFRAKIKADLEKWGEVIKISGATVN